MKWSKKYGSNVWKISFAHNCNGMYCVYGKSTEGLCVDVYRDSSMKKLVSMQHGITTNVENEEEKIEMLKKLIESMAYEF